MKKVMEFKLDKETKGALRYAEVAPSKDQLVRTIYLRKDKVEGIPKAITITMETKEEGGDNV